ncbi:lanthionine synthetase LanC family protein [Actinophytocola sp.]|uniref:lanthionine synthetase LanC family protein n=1 Tax=Actinophytocola sp. TaxID=1872138 RepID=UPI003D6A8F10
MSGPGAETFHELAESGWRWVLDQVGWDDDGPWIPESVPGRLTPSYRYGMNSGIGSLALVLAEVRLVRPWTVEERSLADAVADRLLARIAAETDCTYFHGLVSTIGVLTALGTGGAEAAVDRLLALATPDGWPQRVLDECRFLPGARINDVVLGTAGVLLGGLWARRAGVRRGGELAERAAAVLLAERETVPTGLDWPFVPRRFRTDADARMPNFSHGVAGIAAALALAGAELGRPGLTGAARLGVEHLVCLGDPSDGGFVVPRRIPAAADHDEFTYSWCHGPTGTSLLFLALERAGVDDIAGESPLTWHRRCLHSIRTSGLPARLRPGFWDNDGRCCGTAGVGEVFLDSWQRAGADDDLAFALHLAGTLVGRAVRDGPHAWWRFVEHRVPEPLLPPGVGWMQGAAGIVAFLLRVARIMRDGPGAGAVRRMDTWWALPPVPAAGRPAV